MKKLIKIGIGIGIFLVFIIAINVSYSSGMNKAKLLYASSDDFTAYECNQQIMDNYNIVTNYLNQAENRLIGQLKITDQQCDISFDRYKAFESEINKLSQEIPSTAREQVS